ncbi:hypothetical protein [Petroclostridium sp. X23]|uniref:hypothetical protein n=1 Tax=Petroclostridium sp. X23 TaxID=3045146 RepID=UPI0024ACFB94|nr:hypothetical protein [Petroclostridium sp. X23]WHH58476.1 hypothetical protein QKW49_22185 [Petroclostridium sp. X23]
MSSRLNYVDKLPRYSAEIFNSEPIFTIGKGKSSDGSVIDYSRFIVNGPFSALDLQGRSISVKEGQNFETTGTGWNPTTLNGIGYSESSTEKALFGSKSYKGVVASLSGSSRLEKTFDVVVGHKYYVLGHIYPKYATTTFISFAGVSLPSITPTANQWNKVSGVVTSTNTDPFRFYHVTNVNYAIGDVIYFDGLMLIDLAANGLDGYTKEQLDVMLHWMSTGAQSTIGDLRIKSIGKNLFAEKSLINSTLNNEKYYVLDTNDSQNRLYNINLKVNTDFTLSCYAKTTSGSERLRLRLFYADGTTSDIFSTNFLTTTEGLVNMPIVVNKKISHVSLMRGTAGNTLYIKANSIMLNNGVTQEPYEPYKESIIYISLQDYLRSLPTVKDVIDVVDGLLTKKVKPYTLQGSDYITTTTSQTYVDYAVYKLPSDCANLGLTGTITGQVYIPNKTESIYQSEIPTAEVGKFFTGNASGENRIYFIIEKGTVATARTEIEGILTCNYQLAQNITHKAGDGSGFEIEVEGDFKAYKDGTVIQEAYYKRKQFYAGGITFDKPLSAIDKVKKVEGAEVIEIPLSDVQLSSDGLSCTITGAADGEVYIPYGSYRLEESTNGTVVSKYVINQEAADQEGLRLAQMTASTLSQFISDQNAVNVSFDYRLSLLEI